MEAWSGESLAQVTSLRDDCWPKQPARNPAAPPNLPGTPTTRLGEQSQEGPSLHHVCWVTLGWVLHLSELCRLR